MASYSIHSFALLKNNFLKTSVHSEQKVVEVEVEIEKTWDTWAAPEITLSKTLVSKWLRIVIMFRLVILVVVLVSSIENDKLESSLL